MLLHTPIHSHMLPLMSLVPTPPLSTFTLRSTFLHHLLLLCSHSMYNTCEFFTPMPQNNQPVLSFACSDPCNVDTPPPTHYFLLKFANPRCDQVKYMNLPAANPSPMPQIHSTLGGSTRTLPPNLLTGDEVTGTDDAS